MTKYLKELDYKDLFFISTGHILGAGIFVLLGKISKYAGYHSWLSILIAGFVAIWLAQSFIYISKKYKKNDAEHEAIEETFGKKPSNLVTAGILLGNLMSCLVVAISFGGYFTHLLPGGHTFGSFVCIVLSAIVGVVGIKETSLFTNITTIMETSGLYLIIGLGAFYLFKNYGKFKIALISYFASLSTLSSFKSWKGILIGAFLIMFAFFGFETVIRFVEESKKPLVDVPRAINHSLYFTTFTYLLIAITSVSVLSPDKLGDSIAPLADVIETIPYGKIVAPYLSFTALVSTMNTFLLTSTGVSRFINEYFKDISKKTGLGFLEYFTRLNSYTQTPVNATVLVNVIVVLLLMSKIGIVPATAIGNIGIFVGLFAIKLADIMGKR